MDQRRIGGLSFSTPLQPAAAFLSSVSLGVPQRSLSLNMCICTSVFFNCTCALYHMRLSLCLFGTYGAGPEATGLSPRCLLSVLSATTSHALSFTFYTPLVFGVFCPAPPFVSLISSALFFFLPLFLPLSPCVLALCSGFICLLHYQQYFSHQCPTTPAWSQLSPNPSTHGNHLRGAGLSLPPLLPYPPFCSPHTAHYTPLSWLDFSTCCLHFFIWFCILII